MRIGVIQFLLTLLLFSCLEKRDKKARVDNSRFLNIADTIINEKGVPISVIELEKLFYTNHYKDIVSTGYLFDTQEKICIYNSALIDNNKYTEVSHLLHLYQPEKYFITSNSIAVPVYSKSIDQYLLF